MTRARRHSASAYCLVVTLLIVVGFPLAYLCYSAFSSFHYGRITGFAGIANFVHVLTDPNFYDALIATLTFTVVTVSGQVLLGLGFALLINSAGRGERGVRLIAMVPYMVSMVAAGVSFRWMFNTEYGFFNFLLQLLGLTNDPINFLGRPGTAMMSIVIAHLWSQTPFAMLIILAGLKSVPGVLYESADIDGAAVFRKFRMITLPLIREQLLVVLLIRTMFALRHFPLPYTMTGGGPGTTTRVLVLLLREKMTYLAFGYNSALSIIMMIITLIIAAGYLRFMTLGRE